MCAEEHEYKSYSDIVTNSVRNAYKRTQIGQLRKPITEIAVSIIMAGSLVLSGYLITQGHMTIGAFLAFILALVSSYQPAKGLARMADPIQHGFMAADRLFEFLDSEPTIKDAPDAKTLLRAPISIKFDNVSFAYNKENGDILRNVSFEAKPGKVCALVGPSGGGKSTIFNLLERFYDPHCGKVLFDGTDIRKFTLASLRHNIAMVSQDVFLFHGSIYDNIRYGKPDATKEQIEAAAKTANAHNFITEELPDGYDTNVGDRGTSLSGGQRQRIAIARAILQDAPILLLDEATSALDNITQKHVAQSLNGLKCTRIVIAHRLSTIKQCGRIIYLDKGNLFRPHNGARLS